MSVGRRVSESIVLVGLTPWRLPARATLERLDEVLWGSMLLTTVTVACVGAAMCDQAAAQSLRLLGDLSIIGAEYIVLGFEEFGPMIVALTLAARVGAGFAAEVATLSSEQTLDMLEVFGASPVRTRLAPMGVACVVGGMCLGLISAFTWEVAGTLVMNLRYGVNPFTFVRLEALGVHSVVLCVLKTGLMGGLVFVGALVAGLRARGDAEAVGDATTRAGVYALVLVLSCNLIIDVIWFMSKGPT